MDLRWLTAASAPVARIYFLAVLAAGFIPLVGCEPTRSKTIEELYAEERELPALYLTAVTNRRVTTNGDKGVFIDETTGELAWPAKVCNNPNCPGRSDDEPFVFIAPDPGVVLKPDGTIGYDRSKEKVLDNNYGLCPKCLAARSLKAETDADRKRYADYVQTYVLPETDRRRKELAELRQEREKQLQERMQRRPEG